MHVLQAVRWGIEAWDNMKPEVIEACWLKARVLSAKYGPLPKNATEADSSDDETRYTADLQAQLEVLEDSGRFKEAMNLQNFLNPESEIVDDTGEEIVDQIVARFGKEIDIETDEEIEVRPKVSLVEQIKALDTVIEGMEQSSEASSTDLKMLRDFRRYRQTLTAKKDQSKKQQGLTQFFSKTTL